MISKEEIDRLKLPKRRSLPGAPSENAKPSCVSQKERDEKEKEKAKELEKEASEEKRRAKNYNPLDALDSQFNSDSDDESLTRNKGCRKMYRSNTIAISSHDQKSSTEELPRSVKGSSSQSTSRDNHSARSGVSKDSQKSEHHEHRVRREKTSAGIIAVAKSSESHSSAKGSSSVDFSSSTEARRKHRKSSGSKQPMESSGKLRSATVSKHSESHRCLSGEPRPERQEGIRREKSLTELNLHGERSRDPNPAPKQRGALGAPRLSSPPTRAGVPPPHKPQSPGSPRAPPQQQQQSPGTAAGLHAGAKPALGTPPPGQCQKPPGAASSTPPGTFPKSASHAALSHASPPPPPVSPLLPPAPVSPLSRPAGPPPAASPVSSHASPPVGASLPPPHPPHPSPPQIPAVPQTTVQASGGVPVVLNQPVFLAGPGMTMNQPVILTEMKTATGQTVLVAQPVPPGTVHPAPGTAGQPHAERQQVSPHPCSPAARPAPPSSGFSSSPPPPPPSGSGRKTQPPLGQERSKPANSGSAPPPRAGAVPSAAVPHPNGASASPRPAPEKLPPQRINATASFTGTPPQPATSVKPVTPARTGAQHPSPEHSSEHRPADAVQRRLETPRRPPVTVGERPSESGSSATTHL